ncbi:MAG: rod-binding protein, partial [Defluviitaleaceae bacterium]|nr:rod-binding protein [Defluviitaleaceae bacterium]
MDFSAINTQMTQHAINAANRSNNLENLDLAAISGDDVAMMAAAKEFEAYFVQMMFRAMRNTVNSENSLFPRTQTEEIFQDMLDEKTARAAVQQGNGMGLAQQIFRQMTAGRNSLQEVLLAQSQQIDFSENYYDGSYG